MNKTVLIIITIGLVVALWVIFLGSNSKFDNDSDISEQNTEIRDGVQYITINAKGGYWPRISSAKAGLPTKLIMKTTGSFDCSSSLAIRSVGFQEILPSAGETEIDIGIPKSGEPLQGVCSMGMYSFLVNFD